MFRNWSPAVALWCALAFPYGMSVLANQPTKSKPTKLGRIAQFGLPVPPRISQFFEGGELVQYDGARGWGFEGWSGDTKMKVKWGSSQLDDIVDHVFDGGRDELVATNYLPIAALGDDMNMFAVKLEDAALPVYYFDHDSGFKEWAPDFEAFLRKLLRKGERTPSEKLDAAYEKATELNEAKQHAEVISILEPVISQFPTDLDEYDDSRDTLGASYNLVGIAHEHLGDIARAVATYELAYKLGTDSAALNVCDLWLNHFKDYPRLIEYAEALREKVWGWSDEYAYFHVRNYLGHGYLLTKQPAAAVRAYHQIFDQFAADDPAKVKQAVDELRELVAERPEPERGGTPPASPVGLAAASGIDRATAEGILAWLDAPPRPLSADKLAAMRTWWTALPESVSTAIRETLKVEGEPSDADFSRIAGITELEIEDVDLDDLRWVSMLDKLEELDLENNDIDDLSPLATLTRLRDLDISQNDVTSLRPLAELRAMERLSVGENDLAGLEGVENMRRLHYLHANEAELTSIEPLRGLPELVDVTLYQNDIGDISPLAESPRIKEISSFTNPLTTGFPTLARLPWLESVDAGDETPDDDVRALKAANPLVAIDHWNPDDDEENGEKEEKPDPGLPAVRAWWTGLSPEWRKILDKERDSDEHAKDRPTDSALLELVRKDSLHVDEQPLPDLDALRRFTRLDYLNIGKSNTSDLTAIAKLPRLRDLLIRDNPLRSLAPLVDAPVLEELFMERCRLGSLAGLERCFTLRELYAEDNAVEDLGPLAGLTQLRVIDLENNRVRSLVPLAKLQRLHTLKLGLNQVTDLSPLAGCRELRIVEVWANPNVRGATALLDLPELTRVITHGSLPPNELAELRRRRPDVVSD